MKVLLACLLLFSTCLAPGADLLTGARRILVLGDSITHSGQYVDDFEAQLWLQAAPGQSPPEVINLGLPSETVSGLSEEGHAGGKFPRPDLHERLGRVLDKIQPDLVFACYGMNDGIYLPLAEDRFAAFRQGMEKLHRAVEGRGASIVHLTLPVHDAGPGRPPGYDLVLAKYAEWLGQQRAAQGWQVIDLHTPMAQALAAERARNPEFLFAKDGVHPNGAGHRVLAQAWLAGLGRPSEFPGTPEFATLLKLIRTRGRLLTDAWLNETGHLRPGMAKGLPLAEAQAKAAALQPEILAAAQAARMVAK